MTVCVKSESNSRLCYEIKFPDPEPEDIAAIGNDAYTERILERLKNYLTFGYWWCYKNESKEYA